MNTWKSDYTFCWPVKQESRGHSQKTYVEEVIKTLIDAIKEF